MLPIFLVGVGLVAGCMGELPSEESSSASLQPVEADMCAEHGVLEAVCTQCNTALIPVFQSKGDWCDEHGFPESFCPICSPEAGGRPGQADLSVDGSPADGTRVRFKTREAAQLAGIEVVEALQSPWVGGTEAVARLDWDATQVALVSARAPGMVTSIAADVGMPVEPGAVLATMRSAHVGGDRSRVAAAERAVVVAEAEVARKQDLLASGVTSQRAVLAAEQELARARGELGALRAELGLVGGGSGDRFAVTAPLGGVVTQRLATVGQSVDVDMPLFQIVDPSRMWAELDVAEADLGSVRQGQAVRLVLDALPERGFEGTLEYLAPMVDPQTRTARGRVVLENPEGLLRAHMYGTAMIVTDTEQAVVTVPSESVQSAGQAQLVFVREAVDHFVARRVRVVSRVGGQVRVVGSVKPGDLVVTTGSFLLKTETLKDSIGAGCCDVE